MPQGAEEQAPARPDAETDSSAVLAISSSKALEVGDWVEGLYSEDGEWYGATIMSIVGADLYRLKWEDEEYGEENKPGSEIRLFAKAKAEDDHIVKKDVVVDELEAAAQPKCCSVS